MVAFFSQIYIRFFPSLPEELDSFAKALVGERERERERERDMNVDVCSGF